MPFDGSGNLIRLYSWTADRDAGIKILSTKMDSEFDNVVFSINQILQGLIDYKGQIRNVSGTQGLPAYSFVGDTDTGLFRESANKVALTAGGQKALDASDTLVSVLKKLSLVLSGDVTLGTPSGIEINSKTPSIMLTDTDSGAGALLFYFNGNTLKVDVDTQNDGQIGNSTNTSDETLLTLSTSSFLYKTNTLFHSGNDGVGSGLDADLLDGQQGSFYQNATNINAGTLSNLRLPNPLNVNTVQTDTINESTLNNGINVDGVIMKDGGLLVSNAIETNGNLNLLIDADNNTTAGAVQIYCDSVTTSNLRMSISEAGRLNIYSTAGDNILKLIDTAPDTITANPFMTFDFNTSIGGSVTRLGYFGFTSTVNGDLSLINEVSASDVVIGGKRNTNIVLDNDNNDTNSRFYVTNSLGGEVFNAQETGVVGVLSQLTGVGGAYLPLLSVDRIDFSVNTNSILSDAEGLKIRQMQADANAVYLDSVGNAIVNIDINNNNTSTYFAINKNNTTRIFTVNEDSTVDIFGLLDTHSANILIGTGQVHFASYGSDYISFDDATNRYNFFADGAIANSLVFAGAVNFGNDNVTTAVSGTWTVNVVNGVQGNATIDVRYKQDYTRMHNTCQYYAFLKVPAMTGADAVNSYITLPYNINVSGDIGTWCGWNFSFASGSALETAIGNGTENPLNGGKLIGIGGTNRAYFRDINGNVISFASVENRWLTISGTYYAT